MCSRRLGEVPCGLLPACCRWQRPLQLSTAICNSALGDLGNGCSRSWVAPNRGCVTTVRLTGGCVQEAIHPSALAGPACYKPGPVFQLHARMTAHTLWAAASTLQEADGSTLGRWRAAAVAGALQGKLTAGSRCPSERHSDAAWKRNRSPGCAAGAHNSCLSHSAVLSDPGQMPAAATTTAFLRSLQRFTAPTAAAVSLCELRPRPVWRGSPLPASLPAAPHGARSRYSQRISSS